MCGQTRRSLAGVKSVFLDLVAGEPELIDTRVPLVKPADHRGKKAKPDKQKALVLSFQEVIKHS